MSREIMFQGLSHLGTEPTVHQRGKGGREMGLSLSVLLIAVGAILTWAVNAQVSGIDLQVAGVILMVVGAIGLIASLIFWSSWGGFGSRDAAAAGGQNTTIVERDRT
jgi:hypothetical protein